MGITDIKKIKKKIYQIATKHGIRKVYVFGSVARGESSGGSDVDYLIEMDEDAPVFGVGAFQYEVQQLLGVRVDVIPTFALKNVDDQNFIHTVLSDAVII